jgi:hypothetical protein
MFLCAIAGALCLVQSRADAITTKSQNSQNGSLCQGATTSDRANLGYSQYGVGNTSSTSSATVICSIAHDAYTAQFDYGGVWVYDRNCSSDVSVTLYLADGAGNASYTTTVTSSGCSSGSTFKSLGVTGGPFAPIQAFIVATIPPVYGGNFSHVASYFESVSQ